MSDKPLVSFDVRGAITVGQIEAGSVLDAMNVSQFGAQVGDYVKRNPGLRLLLDFGRVEYLSSAVLTELLRINQACKADGGDLKLCSLNKDIAKVFEITNLDKLFTIYSAPADEAVIKYARSLTIEAEETAWSHVQKDV
ncbi:MAG: STAS domain-containing protein [Candidatus Hydrogenedentes bacterium]|nr:STAS domain-containing protein [Candidatus Hydrogenedentota bacterium]